MQTDELCELCLTARDPLDRAFDRRMLRERALIHLRLLRGLISLRSGEDLLSLWGEATRHEPWIREFVDEPRWRSEVDGTPFTGAKLAAIYGARQLAPGDETDIMGKSMGACMLFKDGWVERIIDAVKAVCPTATFSVLENPLWS